MFFSNIHDERAKEHDVKKNKKFFKTSCSFEKKDYTENKLISSEHAGGLSDTYYGKVSIYGKDRKQVGIVWKYPHCCRITYDVQGEITTARIFSNGEKDGVVRTKEVTVKDKWNFGSKTTAQGYVELAPVTGESVSSIGDAEK